MFVAGFIGSPQMNFIDGKVLKEGDKFFVEFGSEDTKTRAGVKYKILLPDYKNDKDALVPYVDKEVIIGIRPEHVHNEENYLETIPEGIVEADVEVTELMGAETYLYMNCEGHNINARVDPSSTARPGDKIKITIDPKKIHIFDKETQQTICN
jgi:multiple sugar transport system ATP-binding protein